MKVQKSINFILGEKLKKINMIAKKLNNPSKILMTGNTNAHITKKYGL